MIENIVLTMLLWGVFGVQHSVLARPRTKAAIQDCCGVFFTLRLYPVLYFLSQCIIFLFIYDILKHLKPSVTLYQLSVELDNFRYLLNRAANIFLIITIFHFDVARFVGFSQLLSIFIRINDKKTEQNLNKRFLYKYIRHPMYLGIILVYLTSTSSYNELYFINLACIIFYIEVGSFYEERSLIEKFGDSYVLYQSQTAKYIPFIR